MTNSDTRVSARTSRMDFRDPNRDGAIGIIPLGEAMGRVVSLLVCLYGLYGYGNKHKEAAGRCDGLLFTIGKHDTSGLV